jgi:hypothetical protein
MLGYVILTLCFFMFLIKAGNDADSFRDIYIGLMGGNWLSRCLVSRTGEMKGFIEFPGV